MNNSTKKVIGDLILNVVAYSLPVVAAQAFTLPIVNSRSSSDYYGYVLALVSILNIVPQTIGNTLNNVRLIRATEYENVGVNGDYRLLLRKYGLAGLIITAIAYLLLAGSNWMDPLELGAFILLSAVWTLREYILVGYRLELNYRGIAISSFLYSVGLIIGTILYMYGIMGKYWIFIYLAAQLFSIVYINRSFSVCSEAVQESPLLRETQKAYNKLLVPNSLNAMSVNFDKILIFPILGGTAVSVFFAASIFTKIISIAITPVSTVLLSYLARMKSIARRTIHSALVVTSLISVLGYLICILIAKPVITLIYPTYVDEAMQFIHYTSVNAMLVFAYSLLRPFLLKFIRLEWHLWLNIISLAAYVLASLLLVPVYGLYGMCYALIIGSTLKLVLVIFPLLIYNNSGKSG